MIVTAIDPGGTTGITVVNKTNREVQLHCYQEKLSCRDFYLWLRDAVSATDYYICESFEYRQRARAGLDLTPAHLIGVVMAFVPENKLYMQTAAQGKGHFSNDKLKKLGIYIPGKEHAMDSLRHFMQWYTFGAGYRYYDLNAKLCLIDTSATV